jgi:aminopeptidase N
MEYPMMVNDNPLTDRAEDIFLTDHEIFHTMFPFYMGINETKYAFMDEGWATIGEWLISSMIDSTLQDRDGVQAYSVLSGREDDLPIITPSTQETGNAYFLNSYPKPGLGYLYARDILGDSLFLQGVHQYIRNWAGKHPLPLDFFASMNAGTHQNLDWFWYRWFYENSYPDLALTSVRKEEGGWLVLIDNKGGKPVPVELDIDYGDGHSEHIHRPASVWESTATLPLHLPDKGPIAKVTLKGPYYVDQNPKDNIFIVQ